jgi:hypothetical protein
MAALILCRVHSFNLCSCCGNINNTSTFLGLVPTSCSSVGFSPATLLGMGMGHAVDRTWISFRCIYPTLVNMLLRTTMLCRKSMCLLEFHWFAQKSRKSIRCFSSTLMDHGTMNWPLQCSVMTRLFSAGRGIQLSYPRTTHILQDTGLMTRMTMVHVPRCSGRVDFFWTAQG